MRRDYEPKPLSAVPYRRPESDARADEIAGLVREIAANRRALLPHRAVVRELGRIVKDPWKTGPVEADRKALLATLPKKDLVSVRLDAGVDVAGRPAGRARRVDERTLAFRRGREETGRVVGDPPRIDLLAVLVGDKPVDDVVRLLLPKDLARLARAEGETVAAVERLLADGREKVARVERLVCALYGLEDELTEAVVQHAVDRDAR
ncbi:MAG: hypothetical protein ACRDQT_08005 [Gaiellaceae bacterium]